MRSMEDQQQDSRRSNDKQYPKKLPKSRRPRVPKNQFRGDDDFNWGKIIKVILTWTAIVLCVLLVMLLVKTQEGTEYPIGYSDYLGLLKEGAIKDADIRKSDKDNYDFHGELKRTTNLTIITGKALPVDKFVVTLPYIDGTVIKEWTDQGIAFKITKEDSTWVNMLLSTLPWAILIGAWLIIMRRMQGIGTKGIFSFGKSRAKAQVEGGPKVTFADV